MKTVRLSALRTGRLYHPGNIPGTHFCWRPIQPKGQSAAGRIMSMKNSNETIGNRTRHLPICSAVPQLTAPPRTPSHQPNLTPYVYTCKYKCLYVFTTKFKTRLDLNPSSCWTICGICLYLIKLWVISNIHRQHNFVFWFLLVRQSIIFDTTLQASADRRHHPH